MSPEYKPLGYHLGEADHHKRHTIIMSALNSIIIMQCVCRSDFFSFREQHYYERLEFLNYAMCRSDMCSDMVIFFEESL